MNILISGIGGPTPRSIAKRLRELYPSAKLIGVDSNNKAIGFYLDNLLTSYYRIPRATDQNYWPKLAEIIEKESIDFAFIQPELEVLAWGEYYVQYSKFLCPVLIPSMTFAKSLINKATMALLLSETDYIPKTVRIDSSEPDLDLVEKNIGYPCWIRASTGSGGLGSLKLNRKEDLIAWLFIHKSIEEFTVSEFLPGRHFANQMMYINGKCIMNAALECVEYVMADIAPSKVTGNTSFGRFSNDERVTEFCEQCMEYISTLVGEQLHGVFSFDLKEDSSGSLKVTEINVRHMAYTGIMAQAGCDLVETTVQYLTNREVQPKGRFRYSEDYIFLRDVDIQPILIKESSLLHS